MAKELPYQELVELLDSVVNNKHLVEIDDGGNEYFVIFSYPSFKHILKSRYIRKSSFLEAERVGLPSSEEIDKIVESRDIFSPEDKASIKELEDKIAGQRRVLQMTKIEGRRQPIIENIARLEDEITSIKMKGAYYQSMSKEYKAEQEANYYLLWASTYTLDGIRLWATFENFKKETDLTLRETLLNKWLDFKRGIPVHKIRYLARHTLWRIRYTAALKIGGSLFSRDLNDLTPTQEALLYWSNYYQSIYDMLPDDRPSDDIIEDDDVLDKYMVAYFKRLETERNNENRVERYSGRKNRLSVTDKEELIITQSHPDYLHMSYSEQRIQASDGAAEVAVVDPNSRRARNRHAARRRR